MDSSGMPTKTVLNRTCAVSFEIWYTYYMHTYKFNLRDKSNTIYFTIYFIRLYHYIDYHVNIYFPCYILIFITAPKLKCTENEVYRACPERCAFDDTCEQAINGIIIPCAPPPPVFICEPKCFCKRGFIRNNDDQCVPVDTCKSHTKF